MKFGKNLKVKWRIITQCQAKSYIRFLDMESDRHSRNIEEAENIIESEQWYKVSPDLDATVELWNTAIKRHKQDIDDIDKLVKQVKEKFNI